MFELVGRPRVPETKRDWLRFAGAPPQSPDAPWKELDNSAQMKLVRHYLTTHRPGLMATEFSGPVVKGGEPEVARKMFNHGELLRHAQEISDDQSHRRVSDIGAGDQVKVTSQTPHRGL